MKVCNCFNDSWTCFDLFQIANVFVLVFLLLEIIEKFEWFDLMNFYAEIAKRNLKFCFKCLWKNFDGFDKGYSDKPILIWDCMLILW